MNVWIFIFFLPLTLDVIFSIEGLKYWKIEIIKFQPLGCQGNTKDNNYC